MHMADALLSPARGLAMNALSVAAIGASVAKVEKDELSEKKIPIMGVAGAMIFAMQMVNFTIPATGSSGHIGGGILLAGLLGGVPAFLSIAAVLIIQCLFFADGGLLALGCNIFNMGLIPCLVIYPLIFKPLLKNGIGYKRLSLASVISVVIGLELGAFCVVLQTLASGITELPFSTFLALMLPIHLVIGLAEGFVTAVVLCFVYKMSPDIIDSSQSRQCLNVSAKKVLVTLALLTVTAGGVLSLFASTNPDGLEWAIGKTTQKVFGTEAGFDPGLNPEGGGFGAGASPPKKTAVLPNYTFASNPDNPAGTPASGLIGAAIVFAFAGMTGLLISKVKRSKKAGAHV
jgi:cobalt/nickel transport system permease protein